MYVLKKVTIGTVLPGHFVAQSVLGRDTWQRNHGVDCEMVQGTEQGCRWRN